MVFTMDRNMSGPSVSICFASHCAGVTLLSAAIDWFSFDLDLATRRITRWPSSFHDATPVTRPNSYTTPVDATQSGYNKRLHNAFSLLKRAIRALAHVTDLWDDPVWVAGPTPVECGRCRPTSRRSELAGWAGYGHSRSRSRWFWGLRLH
nr:hypothetical protein [Nonomuraea ceibae]